MSIATSLDKLSETLTNCKTNLKEKGVEADSIKISDVDEKIMEIQAGGGSNSNEVDLSDTVNFNRINCSIIIFPMHNPDIESISFYDVGKNKAVDTSWVEKDILQEFILDFIMFQIKKLRFHVKLLLMKVQILCIQV